MAVPPGHSAGIRAVLFQAPARRLKNALPALRTNGGIGNLRMPPDVGAHGVGWKAETLCNFTRLEPCQPQGVDLVFNLWFHFVPPNKERMAFMTILSASYLAFPRVFAPSLRLQNRHLSPPLFPGPLITLLKSLFSHRRPRAVSQMEESQGFDRPPGPFDRLTHR